MSYLAQFVRNHFPYIPFWWETEMVSNFLTLLQPLCPLTQGNNYWLFRRARAGKVLCLERWLLRRSLHQYTGWYNSLKKVGLIIMKSSKITWWIDYIQVQYESFNSCWNFQFTNLWVSEHPTGICWAAQLGQIGQRCYNYH